MAERQASYIGKEEKNKMDNSNITKELYGTAEYLCAKLTGEIDSLKLDIKDAAYKRDNKQLAILTGKILNLLKIIKAVFENEETYYTNIINDCMLGNDSLQKYLT